MSEELAYIENYTCPSCDSDSLTIEISFYDEDDVSWTVEKCSVCGAKVDDFPSDFINTIEEEVAAQVDATLEGMRDEYYDQKRRSRDMR
jgi:hypothetical protein